MKPRVYLETSVISYLTSRPSSDLVVSAHQSITAEWWESAQQDLQLVASELVLQEASSGDPDAAKTRVTVLQTIELLSTTEEAIELAESLIQLAVIPEKAADDALHIALCATNGIEFLVTWNCRHIANATLRSRIEAVCRSAGYEPPIICTPEEMAGTYGGELD